MLESNSQALYMCCAQNLALGAFLPQSVAAFASEAPSSLYTKKALHALST